MEQVMTWMLVGTATLGAFALTVLNAWLLLKTILSVLEKASGSEDK